MMGRGFNYSSGGSLGYHAVGGRTPPGSRPSHACGGVGAGSLVTLYTISYQRSSINISRGALSWQAFVRANPTEIYMCSNSASTMGYCSVILILL